MYAALGTVGTKFACQPRHINSALLSSRQSRFLPSALGGSGVEDFVYWEQGRKAMGGGAPLLMDLMASTWAVMLPTMPLRVLSMYCTNPNVLFTWVCTISAALLSSPGTPLMNWSILSVTSAWVGKTPASQQIGPQSSPKHHIAWQRTLYVGMSSSLLDLVFRRGHCGSPQVDCSVWPVAASKSVMVSALDSGVQIAWATVVPASETGLNVLTTPSYDPI